MTRFPNTAMWPNVEKSETFDTRRSLKTFEAKSHGFFPRHNFLVYKMKISGSPRAVVRGLNETSVKSPAWHMAPYWCLVNKRNQLLSLWLPSRSSVCVFWTQLSRAETLFFPGIQILSLYVRILWLAKVIKVTNFIEDWGKWGEPLYRKEKYWRQPNCLTSGDH